MSGIFHHPGPAPRPKRATWLLLFCCLLPLLALACGSWPSTTAAAASDQETAAPVTKPHPSPAEDLRDTASLAAAVVKAFGALALVIGLLLLLSAGLKRLGLGGQSLGGTSLIRILDTRMIAPKKYVAVLDIAGQSLAVGITDQQITLLTRLEEGDVLRAMGDRDRRKEENPSSRFAAFLSRAVAKTKPMPPQDHS
ncbi:MAG: flagellar biosynthetic protein FliO [Desulfobulbaceae bacterium]|nr:flagellar biosynthetic protein FliO [Desulfobulbaceae bacterium]